MTVKNAVAKAWTIALSSDDRRWSAWPAGDKYSFGVLGGEAETLAYGNWVNVTALTNITAITDATGPSGASPATAWTDADSALFKTNIDWPGKATWDAARKRMTYVTAAAGYSSEVPAGAHSAYVKLDIVTGLISRTWNPTGTQQAHVYDGNQSQVWNGKLYRRDYDPGHIYVCDLATDVWTLASDQATYAGAGTGLGGQPVALDVHPNYGAQGSVIMVGYFGRLARFDIASGVVTLLAASTTGVGGVGEVFAFYSPVIDSIVFGGGEPSATLQIHKMNAAGTVSLLSSTVPAGVTNIGPHANGTAANDAQNVILPDPQGRACAWLFDTKTTRKVWRLNLLDGTWSDFGALPATFAVPCWLTGTAIPELGVHVFMDGDARSSPTVSDSRAWLFKPSDMPLWVPDPGKFATVSTGNASTADPDPTNAAIYAGSNGFESVWIAWSGGVYAPTIGTYGALLMYGGGNQTYDSNAILAYDIGTRTFSLLATPTAAHSYVTYGTADSSNTYVDTDGGFVGFTNKPMPIHTYAASAFLPAAAGGGTLGSYVYVTHNQNKVRIMNTVMWRFDIALATWSKQTIWTGVSYTERMGIVYDPTRLGVWLICSPPGDGDAGGGSGSAKLYFYSWVTNTSQEVTMAGSGTTSGQMNRGMYVSVFEYVQSKDCIIFVAAANSLMCIDLAGYTTGAGPVTVTEVTQTGTACPSLWNTTGDSIDKPVYCSEDGALYALNMFAGTTNAALYKLTPPVGVVTGNWAWSNQTLTPQVGGTALALRASTMVTVQEKTFQGRFRYVPALKSFVFSDGRNLPAQMLRPTF